MKRGCILLLLMICTNSLLWAATPVKVTMRNSGYTMGDLIQMRVEIPVPRKQIDADSLPLEGRVASWLDLRQMAISEQNKTTVLHLTWQIFGTVEYSQMLKLPEIPIKTIGKNAQTILIPAQPIYYSSVFSKTVEAEKPRENLPPIRFDEGMPKHIAILSACLTVLFVFIWLWVKDCLPWLPYRPGPLAKLARRFKSQQLPTQLRLQDLREIHEALNASARQSLYPHTVNKLFEKSPFLETDKAVITQFIDATWQVFYGGKVVDIPTDRMLTLLNRAALAERLFRKVR